jgi:hypothetical protein
LNVPSYGVSGSVITDSVTGLQWRKDVIDDKLWSGAGPACAALNVSDAGTPPWRLPTRLELVSLLDFGAVPKLLQPVELDVLTKANSVWTSTDAKGNPGSLAWIVNFSVGNVGGAPKTSALPVRCVRGTPPAPKLQVNATCKVVSDVGTGLMWQQAADAPQYVWQDALKHCEGLVHAETADWRLPSAKELMTIVLDSAVQPAIDAQVFQGALTATYWTSTPNLSKPGDARVVDFSIGASFSNVMSAPFHVRCVRSLQ